MNLSILLLLLWQCTGLFGKLILATPQFTHNNLRGLIVKPLNNKLPRRIKPMGKHIALHMPKNIDYLHRPNKKSYEKSKKSKKNNTLRTKKFNTKKYKIIH